MLWASYVTAILLPDEHTAAHWSLPMLAQHTAHHPAFVLHSCPVPARSALEEGALGSSSPQLHREALRLIYHGAVPLSCHGPGHREHPGLTSPETQEESSSILSLSVPGATPSPPCPLCPLSVYGGSEWPGFMETGVFKGAAWSVGKAACAWGQETQLLGSLRQCRGHQGLPSGRPSLK